MGGKNNTKLAVIGLDGATWELIKPWAMEGKLLTFKKLIENGVWGKLESTIPPVTIPAWISFVTGKNPGRLGCYNFLMPRKSLNDMRPVTTKDIPGKTFYEILYENGKKCIIINLPGSYPPRIKEIIITSFLTQGDNFIFPPDLVDEIPEFKNYRLVPDRSLIVRGKNIDYINDIRELERNRFECAKKLFKKNWDFFFILFSGTDWIQHIMFDILISNDIDDDADLIRAYKEIDEYIGWFIDHAPKNTNFLFMSDHGFSSYKRIFFINEWLRELGYLKVECRARNKTIRHKFEKETEKAMYRRMNIKPPIFLLKYFKLFIWAYPIYLKLKKILPIEIRLDVVQPNLSETIAYTATNWGSNFGGIYINDKIRFIDGTVDFKSYENIRDEIISDLKQLKDPKTGKNVVKNVWKKEEIYTGSHLYAAPDIIFELDNKYHVSLLYAGKVFSDKKVQRNQHSLQGIFLAYGPDIKEGMEVKGIKIYDIAPTILYMFGLPIPRDVDGKVLRNIFKENSRFVKEDIIYQKTEINEKMRIRKRIKELEVLRKI